MTSFEQDLGRNGANFVALQARQERLGHRVNPERPLEWARSAAFNAKARS